MTIYEVRSAVAEINETKRTDQDAAHWKECALFEKVLKVLSEGYHGYHSELATEALRTRERTVVETKLSPVDRLALYGKPAQPAASHWESLSRGSFPGAADITLDPGTPDEFSAFSTVGERWRQNRFEDWEAVKGIPPLPELRAKAEDILDQLCHPFPADHTLRVAQNYNRSCSFHTDPESYWGVLFSFGPRMGYLALSEIERVIQLEHGSVVALNLNAQHGSWVEEARSMGPEFWHLNIVFYSRPEALENAR